MWIQWRGRSGGLNTAKAASPRAGVTHEHDGGSGGRFVGTAPAIRNVGATSFFANGVQIQAPKIGFDFLVVGIVGDGGLEPGGETGKFFPAARGTNNSCAELRVFR